MRLAALVVALSLLPVAGARPRNKKGGPARFDYYLLSLSWSPEHCAEVPSDHTPQCDGSRQFGFVVHGLWPQAERGPNPQNCAGPAFDPNAVTSDLLEIMPSRRLAQHEWETHGRCSGLSEKDYFQKVQDAWVLVKIPAQFKAPQQPIQMTPRQIRQAFDDANPNFPPDAFAINDNGRFLREVRVCYTNELKPRPCAQPGDTRDIKIIVRAVK